VRTLRPGELLSGLSGLALVGFLFLDWFGPEAEASGTSGWSSLGWLAIALCVLAIVAGLALPFLSARNESPVLPVLGTIGATLLGFFAMVALLIQVIAQPGPDELVEVKAGWWLGLIASFGVSIGGWMAMKDETTPNARERPVEVRPAPPVA
jgi:hypothetical protein